MPLPRLLPFIIALIFTSFVTNWLWEMAQMEAYVEMAGRSWLKTAMRCTVAALGDAAITLGICVVGSLAARDWEWGSARRWNVYAFASIMGLGCAAAFEWYSLATGRWTYNTYMPVVPVLKVGLWPLLQLSTLVPLSFWLSAEFYRRVKSEENRTIVVDRSGKRGKSR